jgi:hypothetical protein
VVVAIAVSCDIDMRKYISPCVYVGFPTTDLPLPGQDDGGGFPTPGTRCAQHRGVGHKGLHRSFRFLFPRGFTQHSPSRADLDGSLFPRQQPIPPPFPLGKGVPCGDAIMRQLVRMSAMEIGDVGGCAERHKLVGNRGESARERVSVDSRVAYIPACREVRISGNGTPSAWPTIRMEPPSLKGRTGGRLPGRVKLVNCY